MSTITRRATALFAAIMLVLSGCGTSEPASTSGTPNESATASSELEIFDSSYVHDVSLSFDQSDYEAMVATYRSTGEKDWIPATVTIDGVTYENAGVRLKGNSSLRGLQTEGSAGGPSGSASEESPEELPWLIRLDKFVDGQNHHGISDLVIRSNASETSLNEAVALELLELAGLATEQAIAVSFTVNDSEATLRLAIEHPDDVWMETYFDEAGALYKAESTGDYSYRGDDPDAYDEIFDQEAGDDNADLTPLLQFLEFINASDDETFAAELPEHLDVEAFATYLAVQELIDNFDDIDGPGNNSYLYYDTGTEMFTVVAWDHNLAFGALDRATEGGVDAPAFGDRRPPEGAPSFGESSDGRPPESAPAFQGGSGGEQPEGLPLGGATPGRAPGGGGAVLGNVLSERFLEDAEFAALYEQKVDELRDLLYDSGAADDVLSSWVETLGTTDLIDDATLQENASAIAEYFAG